jgi:hypothetical protein
MSLKSLRAIGFQAVMTAGFLAVERDKLRIKTKMKIKMETRMNIRITTIVITASRRMKE